MLARFTPVRARVRCQEVGILQIDGMLEKSIPMVRNQAEDVWRDPIDGGEGGPNEAENFKCTVLKSADL